MLGAMSLPEDLLSGTHGVRLAAPPELEVIAHDERMIQAVDAATDTTWWFFFEPNVHLDLAPEHHGDLAAALEHHARLMFEEIHGQLAGDGDKRPPRTVDPSWTAMVEVETVAVDGAPALRTVHRMAYQHGRELVMGHLLVPLRRGLFEVRVLAGDAMTGLREALLVDRLIAAAQGGEVPVLSQAEIDDPAHDAACPQHALSRVRAALAGFRTRATLRVAEPAASIDGERVLRQLGCALTVPARFGGGAEDAVAASFGRTSFCATDGIEHFIVSRGGDISLSAAALRAHAGVETRRIQDDNGVADSDLHVEELVVDGRPHVVARTVYAPIGDDAMFQVAW
jgi:hypothetical protein